MVRRTVRHMDRRKARRMVRGRGMVKRRRAPCTRWAPPALLLPRSVSQKVFRKSLCKSRFPYEFVNLCYSPGLLAHRTRCVCPDPRSISPSCRDVCPSCRDVCSNVSTGYGQASPRAVHPLGATSSPPAQVYLTISQKAFMKLSCESQFSQKIDNLSLIITNKNDELTDLCGT